MLRYIQLSILLMLMCMPSIGYAQTVSLEASLLRDDIPADMQQSSISVLLPLGINYYSTSSYRYLFADQRDFHGLQRIRLPLHTMEQKFDAHFFGSGLAFSALGAITRLPSDVMVGDYYLTASWAWPWMISQGEAPIIFTLKAEGGRSRETSVSTAIQENIFSRQAAAQLDISLMEVLSISARSARQWYNDGNRLDAAYAYLLANLYYQPNISVGYAWAWMDSERSNWTATDVQFDPFTRQFNYQYFYYPYFTPLKERGHHAVAILQWYLFNSVLLHAKATVPVYSRGRLKYMPDAGATPVPVDYHASYEIKDILPTQYEAGLLTDVLAPVTLGMFVEYFSKPYYSYTGGRLVLQYKFED
jgi:hypothetical protein